MPVTCKKSRQFRLGLVNTTFENCMLYKIRPVNIAAKKMSFTETELLGEFKLPESNKIVISKAA